MVKNGKDKHCRPPACATMAGLLPAWIRRHLPYPHLPRPCLSFAGRWLLPLTLGLPAAFAQSPEARFQISIGPNEARAALGELARQTNTPLLYLSQDLDQVSVHGVHGRFTLAEALRIMLQDTGISAELNANGVIAVSVPEPPPEEAEPPDSRVGVDVLAEGLPEEVQGEVSQPDNLPGLLSTRRTQLLEEVFVTGTRLRQRTGMASAVPVTAIFADELYANQPASTLAEQLDALPQFFATQTAQRGGGALYGTAGGSYLNMRGMGPARTLVLFDGARVVPADRGSSVNVDTLPTALLSHVEIVTGGASAAYGADALAGVVNFVIDREFQGLKVSTSSGGTERGDGDNWSVALAGGRRLSERLNLIASVEARRIQEIERGPGDLDNFQRWGYVTNPDWNPSDPPGTRPRLLVRPQVHSTLHSPAGLINQPGFVYDRYTFLDDGSGLRPFVTGEMASRTGPGATGTQSGGPEALLADQAHNGGPYGAEVVGRSAFLGLQFRPDAGSELYAQLMLGHTESNQNDRRGNPHLQTDTWHATIYRDNAFLPEELRLAMEEAGMESIRLDKLGQVQGRNNFNDRRNDRNSHDLRSLALGYRRQLGGDWDLGLTVQHGVAEKTTAVYDNLRVDRLFLAMDAVRDPETGAIVCNVQRVNPSLEQLRAAVAGELVPTQSGMVELPAPIGLDGSISACMPLNVFGLGNASRAAADYVVGDKIGHGQVQQDFFEVLGSGPLLQTTNGPISVALGLTWREESFWQYSTPRELDGPPRNAPELGIRGIPPGFEGGSTSLFQFTGVPVIDGGFHVWEAFGELDAPLWTSRDSRRRLDGSAAWRISDYSLSGEVRSWKLGADLRLSEALRLRGTRSRDVREATFSERFDVQGVGGSVFDPAFDRSAVDITTVAGGNPGLEPEIANTVTLGLVLQPGGALKGLQLSLDWYRIGLKQAIGQLGHQRIVDQCHAGASALCEQITRNAQGILVSVNNAFLNIDSAQARGMDFELVYDRDLDFLPGLTENFSLRALAGYLIENSSTPLGGQTLEQVGGLNWPELTATITAQYQAGPFGLRLQQRYIDSTLLNTDWVEGVDIDDNSVASQSITNLGFSFTGRESNGQTWVLAFDVNNLLDREPPVLPSISQRGGSQTVSSNYDVFGRRYQLRFQIDF